MGGGVFFSSLFPHLYQLSPFHGASITSMCHSHTNPYSWDFRFRKNLDDKVTEVIISLLYTLDYSLLNQDSSAQEDVIMSLGVAFLVNISLIPQ